MKATMTAIAAGTYTIDAAHSEVTFQVRHLVTKVRGRFSDFAGTIAFDEARPEASSVSFSIDAASIDTGTADRDVHLRSEDFFFVEKFPALTFVSDRVTQKAETQFEVRGTLTIRGVSKPIALSVEYVGAATDPYGQHKVGFEAEATLNRKDFGLTWNAALEAGGFLVGDEVRIALSIQAIAQ